MKIGIYGGSFNPIHKGHIQLAEYAIDKLELDKFFFVPAFKSPFKSKHKIVDAKHRVNMIDLVLPEKAEISLFEINRKSVSYTIDTIRYFKQQYPNDELFLIVGSDNVYKLNKWKQINEIVTTAQLVVMRREGTFSKVNIKRYNAILMDNPLMDFASTWFRKGHMHNVDDVVRDYIAKNYLYIPELLASLLDIKRHKHSQAVGALSATLARQVGLDAEKAWAAGCLHDITKGRINEWHRDYLDTHGVDETKYEDYQLHATTGALWVKEEYFLDDKEVLDSIVKHTSLDEELTLFDKVIFAADKLAEGRRWPNIQAYRTDIHKDFNTAFPILVKEVARHLTEAGKMTPDRMKVYEKWM